MTRTSLLHGSGELPIPISVKKGGTAGMSPLTGDIRHERYLSQGETAARAEENIEKLLGHLPAWAARFIRRMRRPRARWVRLPVALCLIPAGFFSFLPVLGLWMLPLGLLLLAVDVPLLQHHVHRFINWLARRRPAWFR
jgi:hypothetical protein